VSSTFWTEHHFAGLALILGALLFLRGAGLYTAVRDTKGNLIEPLPIVSEDALIGNALEKSQFSSVTIQRVRSRSSVNPHASKMAAAFSR